MRSTWKIPNFYKTKRTIFKSTAFRSLRLYSRNFSFSNHFVGRSVSIHNGRTMFNVMVRPTMVGLSPHMFSFPKRTGSGIHNLKKKNSPPKRR